MTRVVLIGYAPDALDLSDPGLAPGVTAEAIRTGIETGLQRMRDRGWEADFCALHPDDGAGPAVEACLGATTYDCAVIGGGVRLSQRYPAIFEAVIEAVRRAAPSTPIAFNTRPEDSADAAERRLAAP